MDTLHQGTQHFVEGLKKDSNVLGVLLFGSWARGNSRPNSDIDLVVIVKEGLSRTVEYREGQAFEIIYTTEKGALDFWESHKDDAAGFWEVAKVLYDVDGTIANLEAEVRVLLQDGKKPLDELQRAQLRFDAEDVLRYVEYVHAADVATANLLLMNKVSSLTELFFDLRQLWTPAPKQRFAQIHEKSPIFHELLASFYSNSASFNDRLMLAKQMLPIIFDRD